MDFNQSKTNDIQQNQKFKRLNQWAIDNGVLMKGVDFPALFGNVIGVVASEDIPSDTVIICIPQTLIISPDKCKQSILNKVYNSHPEMFDEEETDDAEFNILIFYMFNEKKKGELSFYYPYIETIQTNNTLMSWSNDDLLKIEDPIILDEFQQIKQDFLGLWSKAKLIFDNAEDVFGTPRITDKNDFYWAIECVTSRCFGWALKQTCLIPIADFLNHSNQACTHYMVHQGLEKGNGLKSIEQIKFQQQYIIKRNQINLNILGIENNNEIQQQEDQKNAFIKENKKYLQDIIVDFEILSISDKRDLINKIHYQQIMQNPQMNIWDVESFTSSDSEDNDSDEEIKLAKQQQFEIFNIKELAEWKIRKEQKRIESEFQKINLKNQSTVTVTLNPEKKNKVIIKGLQQYQIEAIKLKQQIIKSTLRKQQQQEDEQKQSNKIEFREEEQQWDWLNEYDNEAYFCITTTLPIKKYEQVTVSYGNRTNRFLLSWYGFALLDNIYSSFNFRLWMNTDILQDEEKSIDQILNTIIIKKMIQEDESIIDKIQYNGYEIPISSLSKEFRIKKDKLNMDIIYFLRLYLQLKYRNEKDILSTIPVQIDYEIVVMQFYYSLLQNLINSYSQDLIQDLKELEQTFEHPKRFAIYINKERKEILINQSKIVTEAIQILKRFKEIQNLRESYISNINTSITIIKGLKEYLKILNEFL